MRTAVVIRVQQGKQSAMCDPHNAQKPRSEARKLPHSQLAAGEGICEIHLIR